MNPRNRLCVLSTLSLLAFACSGSDETSVGAGGVASAGAGMGGMVAAGGAAASGGLVAVGASSSTPVPSGGATAVVGSTLAGGAATGGVAAVGGTVGTGGTVAVGSTSAATGGTKATGGSASTGGTKATGGTSAAAGGTKATGGTSAAAGGTKATGGTSAATGGSTGACKPPAAGAKGTNPLFSEVYTADPSALVHNCTFYINCGHDEGTGNGFVMNNWFILKSTDMVNWTRVNNALTLGAFKWANGNAWAGQMVTKGGKFYWFVPVNKSGSCPNNCGMAIGVAVGDSPEGPFTDYLGKPLIDDLIEMANWNYTLDSDTPYTIDPTVFVDDDGQAYLQYGGFGRLSGVKVNLDGNNVSLNGKLATVSGLTGFFEAPFLTKINGTYYNFYARDANPAKIDYATASNPMGPFTYRGRILDSLPTNSTDAATSHPAVAQFAGQWYLVYHVSNGPNGGGTYHRMVAVDKITVNADGTIPKITPTSGLTF